jgi:hypothetical protein
MRLYRVTINDGVSSLNRFVLADGFGLAVAAALTEHNSGMGAENALNSSGAVVEDLGVPLQMQDVAEARDNWLGPK